MVMGIVVCVFEKKYLKEYLSQFPSYTNFNQFDGMLIMVKQSHFDIIFFKNVNTPEYLNSILEQIDNHLKCIHISTPDIEMAKGYVDPSPVKDFNPKDNEQEFIDNHPDEKFNEHSNTNPIKNVGNFDE